MANLRSRIHYVLTCAAGTVIGTTIGMTMIKGWDAYRRTDILTSHTCNGLKGNYVVELKKRVPESWHPWSHKNYVPLAADGKTTYHGCCTGIMCRYCGHVKSEKIESGEKLKGSANYSHHYPFDSDLKPWVAVSEVKPNPLSVFLFGKEPVNMTDFLNESRNVVNTKSN